MLSKDMMQTIDSSSKHFITGIAITGSKTVYPLTHIQIQNLFTDSNLSEHST